MAGQPEMSDKNRNNFGHSFAGLSAKVRAIRLRPQTPLADQAGPGSHASLGPACFWLPICEMEHRNLRQSRVVVGRMAPRVPSNFGLPSAAPSSQPGGAVLPPACRMSETVWPIRPYLFGWCRGAPHTLRVAIGPCRGSSAARQGSCQPPDQDCPRSGKRWRPAGSCGRFK